MALGFERARSGLYIAIVCLLILVFGLMVGSLNKEKEPDEKKPMLTASATFLVFAFVLLGFFGLLGGIHGVNLIN